MSMRIYASRGNFDGIDQKDRPSEDGVFKKLIKIDNTNKAKEKGDDILDFGYS